MLGRSHKRSLVSKLASLSLCNGDETTDIILRYVEKLRQLTSKDAHALKYWSRSGIAEERRRQGL